MHLYSHLQKSWQQKKVSDEDDGTGGLPPVKEKDVVMCRLYRPYYCQFFEDCHGVRRLRLAKQTKYIF